MKRVTFLTLSIIISFTSFAQLESGGFYVSASGDFAFTNLDVKIKADGVPDIDQSIQRTTTFEPRIGFFVIDRLVGGIGLQLENSRSEDPTGDVFKSSNFLTGPFIRYYIDGENFVPFIEGAIGFGSVKTVMEGAFGSSENKNKLSGFNLTIGGAYFLADVVSVDFGVSYNSQTIDFSNSPGALPGSKAVGSGIGALIGFSIYL